MKEGFFDLNTCQFNQNEPTEKNRKINENKTEINYVIITLFNYLHLINYELIIINLN